MEENHKINFYAANRIKIAYFTKQWRIFSYKFFILLLIVLFLLEYIYVLVSNRATAKMAKFKIHRNVVNQINTEKSFDNTSSSITKYNIDSILLKLNDTKSMIIPNNYSERPKNKELCPLVPTNLIGRQEVKMNSPSFEILEQSFKYLHPGGHYKPTHCQARYKVAIIVPFRDRESHLRIFLHNLHPFLRKQQLDYGIYVIEQTYNKPFNRAMLMNVGYVEALKDYDYDCFIFHDVDLIPEDDRNIYSCPEQPRHMSVAIDIFNYKLSYQDLFGGVCAITKEQMTLVNGFSNEFWGWGAEDDDMAHRLAYHHLNITRYSEDIARYTMLKHPKEKPNDKKDELLLYGQSRFAIDGLNNLSYKKINILHKKLYVWIFVEI